MCKMWASKIQLVFFQTENLVISVTRVDLKDFVLEIYEKECPLPIKEE